MMVGYTLYCYVPGLSIVQFSKNRYAGLNGHPHMRKGADPASETYIPVLRMSDDGQSPGN
jgi:hypothetical protein